MARGGTRDDEGGDNLKCIKYSIRSMHRHLIMTCWQERYLNSYSTNMTFDRQRCSESYVDFDRSHSMLSTFLSLGIGSTYLKVS